MYTRNLTVLASGFLYFLLASFSLHATSLEERDLTPEVKVSKKMLDNIEYSVVTTRTVAATSFLAFCYQAGAVTKRHIPTRSRLFHGATALALLFPTYFLTESYYKLCKTSKYHEKQYNTLLWK